MAELILKPGAEVTYQQKRYCIESPINLNQVLLKDLTTGETLPAKISDLTPVSDSKKQNARENTTDLILISDADWEEAKRRETILRPLTDVYKCSIEQAKIAAKELNLSWRQIYNLLKRYRDYDRQLLALLPQKPTGGKGRVRIHLTTEQIVQSIIETRYLNTQQTRISLVVEEIILGCVKAGIRPPSERTIRRRIDNLSDKLVAESRRSHHASKQYASVHGYFPKTEKPHSIWQIDHTPVDLIIVDDIYRKPIGRPYLTLAIDVNSRCIPGFCLTLESPSATSVGLCLTHAVFDKEEWLKKRGIKTEWPIWGKPDCIHVDNGAEFHSEALKRGCEAHGIKLTYRPPGQPHYGGIIERVIGTFMQLVHSIPGTTFSNISEKGDYPSDKKAVLTLSELEYWFTLSITDYYHQKIHRGIHLPPIAQYRSVILGDKDQPGIGYPPKVYNKQEFLIDFLPIEWRTLQRHGFMLDHITYNSPSLSPLIAERRKHKRFLIRRDPRNISHVYILEPHSYRYLEIPYRTLSRPTITLWEHKLAIKYLNERGIFRMNEEVIFQAIERLRELVKDASKKTRSARRQQAKTENHLKHLSARKVPRSKPRPKNLKHNDEREDTEEGVGVIKPFVDIEVW